MSQLLFLSHDERVSWEKTVQEQVPDIMAAMKKRERESEGERYGKKERLAD